MAAGVRMPESAWGLRWQDWLIDACDQDESAAFEIHTKKTEIYPQKLKEHGVWLPMRELALDLFRADYRVHVVTGASSQGAWTAMQFLELPNAMGYFPGMNARNKENFLLDLAQRGYTTGIYFDDKPGVATPEGWEGWRVS